MNRQSLRRRRWTARTAPADPDLLIGLEAIGRYLGENKRRAHYKVKRGIIPAQKNGRLITASKRKIDATLKGA